MNIEIRKLTPDLVDDYVHFFDTTPHATNKVSTNAIVFGGAMKIMKGKTLHHR